MCKVFLWDSMWTSRMFHALHLSSSHFIFLNVLLAISQDLFDYADSHTFPLKYDCITLYVPSKDSNTCFTHETIIEVTGVY